MANDTASKADEPTAPTYSVERLVAESEAFLNVPSFVAVGAFSSERKKNFTLDEAKKLVKDFLKKPEDKD